MTEWQYDWNLENYNQNTDSDYWLWNTLCAEQNISNKNLSNPCTNPTYQREADAWWYWYRHYMWTDNSYSPSDSTVKAWNADYAIFIK